MSNEMTSSANMSREEMEARYRLFQDNVLDDQRNYYKRSIDKYQRSAEQVNWLRAFFALLAGLASAIAGFVVNDAVARGTFDTCEAQSLAAVVAESPNNLPAEFTISEIAASDEVNCTTVEVWVPLLLGVTILAPALGAAFTTLADLYQWDRLTSIYENALDNLEVADAQSPVSEMNNIEYGASMAAFSEGTLSVMSDETAQWGQLVKTPESLQEFIDQARARSSEVGGNPDENRFGGDGGSDPQPSA